MNRSSARRQDFIDWLDMRPNGGTAREISTQTQWGLLSTRQTLRCLVDDSRIVKIGAGLQTRYSSLKHEASARAYATRVCRPAHAELQHRVVREWPAVTHRPGPRSVFEWDGAEA